MEFFKNKLGLTEKEFYALVNSANKSITTQAVFVLIKQRIIFTFKLLGTDRLKLNVMLLNLNQRLKTINTLPPFERLYELSKLAVLHNCFEDYLILADNNTLVKVMADSIFE